MPLNRHSLCDTLRAENDALHSFTEVLREEQQLLIKGRIDELATCAESKARWLLELTRLGEQRLQLLRSRGLTPDRAGMERLLNEHYAGESGECAECDQWLTLMQGATTANQINISNGLLISAHMQTTQRALSTLFSSARLPAAYTPDGGTVSYRAAQQIAVA